MSVLCGGAIDCFVVRWGVREEEGKRESGIEREGREGKRGREEAGERGENVRKDN